LTLAGAVGTILLNGGCITTGPLGWVRNGFKVGPNYHRPPAPVADEWIEAKDARVQGGGHARDGDWWNVFQDSTLNSLLYPASHEHRTPRVRGTRVLQARAQQAIPVGTLFPQTQQATGPYSRVGLSRNMANTPAALVPLRGLTSGALGLIPSAESLTNWYSA